MYVENRKMTERGITEGGEDLVLDLNLITHKI